MADTSDELSPGNFGIQDTIDMGRGDAQLLNDLIEPETASATPEGIEAITIETTPPKDTPKPGVPKEALPTTSPEAENKNTINDFLNSSNDDDDDEEDDTPVVTKPKPETPSEDDDDEEGEDGPKDSQFGALANDLFKLGVFNRDEDEEDISTPEQFLEKFNQEKKRGATEIVENFIGQFGEDYQHAFEAIFVKGADPKEYFSTYNEVVNYAEMDLDQESNQVKVMKQALVDQGFELEDVESEIDRLKNYGDLESVSKKHHKVLVKKEAAKLQQIEQASVQKLQHKQQTKNHFINNVQGILQEKVKNKEFDGIPINPKIASELQDFLLVDKWKTATGETLSDFDRTILDLKRPENHQAKVKIALLMKILETDPTLSSIQKSGITKKTDSLFSEVARQVTRDKSAKPSSGVKDKSSWFNKL